jgi:AcrR family transcriptional regulator
MTEVMRGRRSDSMANHARILEAAQLLLAERGLDIEVDEVAERAGVGVGTLYRHFANRDDLVRSIVAQTLASLWDRLQAAAVIEDPAEALRQITLACAIDDSFFAVLQDPRSAKLLDDVKAKSCISAGELNNLVAGILGRGIQVGAFRPDIDPQIAAAAILGSIGGVFKMLSGARPSSELVSALVDLHGQMVAKR